MDFINLKLIEKTATIMEEIENEYKFDRYILAKTICLSETYDSIFQFEEWLCSQAKSYIKRTFLKEIERLNLPQNKDEDLYAEDIYWFTYLILYWGIKENISGKEIADTYNVNEILDSYETLHTLSIKAAIRKIKEDYKK